MRPLADGGEGTVQALVEGMGGKLCQVTVTGPLGKTVNCEYGILEKSKTAILEMSRGGRHHPGSQRTGTP